MDRLPCSNSNTLILENAGANKPSCSSEQAISHCRQLVQRFASKIRVLSVTISIFPVFGDGVEGTTNFFDAKLVEWIKTHNLNALSPECCVLAGIRQRRVALTEHY